MVIILLLIWEKMLMLTKQLLVQKALKMFPSTVLLLEKKALELYTCALLLLFLFCQLYLVCSAFSLLCILDDCNFVDRVVTFNKVGTLFNYILKCLEYLYGFLWP